MDNLERVKKILEIEEQLKKLKGERATLLNQATRLENHEERTQRIVRTNARRYNPFTESFEPWIINPLRPIRQHPISNKSNELSEEKRAELVKKYRQDADNLTKYKIDPLEKYLEELKAKLSESESRLETEPNDSDESSRMAAAVSEGFVQWKKNGYKDTRTIAGKIARQKFSEVKEFEDGKTKFGRKLLTKEFKDLRERIRKSMERRKSPAMAKKKGNHNR